MICGDFKAFWSLFEIYHLSLLSVEDLLTVYIYTSDFVILLVEGDLWPKDETQPIQPWSEAFIDQATAYLPNLNSQPHTTYALGLCTSFDLKTQPPGELLPQLPVCTSAHTQSCTSCWALKALLSWSLPVFCSTGTPVLSVREIMDLQSHCLFPYLNGQGHLCLAYQGPQHHCSSVPHSRHWQRPMNQWQIHRQGKAYPVTWPSKEVCYCRYCCFPLIVRLPYFAIPSMTVRTIYKYLSSCTSADENPFEHSKFPGGPQTKRKSFLCTAN